ncbi:MAG: cobalamin-dependent protein [Deltaproteobacteria bacterium]|nr:cobalamin-dependent protein [Deltaproteobacteria bacterium]
MKVLLIQQDMGTREAQVPNLPIGLTYIASALKNHQVKIFDPNLYPLSSAMDELKNEMQKFKPDIIGISIRNIDTTNFRNKHVYFNTVKPMVLAIKEINPEIKILAGGSGFSMFAEIIMKKIPEFDFGIFLEGEKSTPELLANLNNPENVKGIFMRKNNQVIYTGDRPLPEFSEIPMPETATEVIDMKNYLGPSYNIIGIQTKRGCLLNCAYCSYPNLNGRQVRLRDTKDIVDQIEYFINQFGMERFVFVDSVFNVPEGHARKILEEMIRRNLDVQFGVWCHMKGITEEFLELLKKAGAVQIDFSPDAATNKGLSALKKGLTEQDIKNTINMARKIKGIGIGFGLFTSLPGYNLTDTIKTLILPFKIQLSLPGRGGGGISYIKIEPDTHIRDIAVKEGLISKDDDLFPKDENDLARMFYRPYSQRYLNMLADGFLGMFERVLKPTAVFVFRTLARIKGKKSAYDQKTGFVSFQKTKK